MTPPRTHLAVLHRRYLDAIIDRSKRVEARLTRNRVAPYQRIQPGDAVYLKQSAGPVRAIARVQRVKTFDLLTPAAVNQLRHDYNHLIRAHPDYWQTKRTARYATLIWLDPPTPLEPADPVPAVPPLCGRAWLAYDDPPPLLRRTA